MRYSDDVIDEVRARNDIVDVISQAVRLEKKGANYFGLCPFHNERTPSFSVSPSKQMFHCFGCGAGGTVFGFVEKYENVSFPEAVEQLAARAGYVLPKGRTDANAQRAREKKQRLLAVNKEAAIWFYYRLREEQGNKGLAYFEKRGLTKETMHRFGLGYAPVSRGALCEYLRGKGFSDADIADAGVAVHDEKSGLKDRFWNRVMFPIQDANRRVIGFGGRVFGDGEPKYLNSPETPVFDKSRNLYGLCFAKNARRGHLILCEGYMDVIAMHQAGFTCAVASLGTAFTQGQASVLKRYAGEVLLAYDSDAAGTKAALRCAAILREAGVKAKILRLAPYKDPDELIRAEGTAGMERRMREAENPFVYEAEVLRERFRMDDPDDVTAFQRTIAEKLATVFEDPAERENYIQAACARYHIDVQLMKDMVARFALRTQPGWTKESTGDLKKPLSGADARAREAREAKRKPQRRLLTLMSENRDVYPAICKHVSPGDFTDPLYRELAEAVFSGCAAEGTVALPQLIDRYEDESLRQEAANAFQETGNGSKDRKMRETELHEVVMGVLQASYEEAVKKADPADASYLNVIREGKQRLEAFSHIQIHLTDKA